jgi:hypothetical protein
MYQVRNLIFLVFCFVLFFKTKACLKTQFSSDGDASLRLSARARQFSSFVMMIGTMESANSFAPTHAMIVKNKDDFVVNLLTETIPSAKQVIVERSNSTVLVTGTYSNILFFFFLSIMSSFATLLNHCRPSSSASQSSFARCNSNRRCLPSCLSKLSRNSSSWCVCTLAFCFRFRFRFRFRFCFFCFFLLFFCRRANLNFARSLRAAVFVDVSSCACRQTR